MVKRYFFSEKKVLLYLVLLGALLRVPGIFDEFWLDEAWSFFLVGLAKSPGEIMLRLTHDNNHPLVSFFMYFVGKGNPFHWMKFRLLSLLAGIMTMPAAYLVGTRVFPDKTRRFLTVAFTSLSFPLIFYASEARGYALVAFFSLLSFYTLREFLYQNNVRLLFAFYCIFVLGFLSHLSFVYVAVGLLGMAVYFQFTQVKGSGLGPKTFGLLKIFFVPAALTAAVYSHFVSRLVYGGMSLTPLPKVLQEIALHLTGFPRDNSYAYILAIIVYLVLAWEIARLFRSNPLLGVFCAGSIMAIFLDILLRRPVFFHFRYFFSIYPFLIILLASFLGHIAGQYRKSRILVASAIFFITAGNLVSCGDFIKIGRGHYREALDYMWKHRKACSITIAGDNDFRNRVLLDFYCRLRPDINAFFVSYPRSRVQAAEWFIVSTTRKNPFIFPYYALGRRVIYRFEKAFPYCGELSGSHWLLYRRAAYVTKKGKKIFF